MAALEREKRLDQLAAAIKAGQALEKQGLRLMGAAEEEDDPE